MKKRKIIFSVFILLLFSAALLYAGKKEEKVPATEKPEVEVKEEKEVETGPKYGGRVVVIMEGEPVHLDNGLFLEEQIEWVSDPINDFLVKYNNDGELVGSLATGWDFVGPKEVEFKLRKGVLFHNGREMTAVDVQKSFMRLLDPNTPVPNRDLYEPIESVEVVDDYTAIFHLKAPNAAILANLTYAPIIPMEVVEKQGDMKTNPVGCGPFKFDYWKKGVEIKLVRHPDYWEKGKPYLDELIFRFLPDYTAAWSTLVSKDADIILWLMGFDVLKIKDGKVRDVHVVGRPVLDYYYIGFNMNLEPWNNKKVREAIKYALDRKAIVDSVVQGVGSEAFVTEDTSSIFYSKTYEYERNIEKAKKLLAEAGYPDGIKAKMVVPKTPVEEPLSIEFQGQLKEIGIDVELEIQEVATFIDNVFNRRNFELVTCGYATIPDPDRLLYPYLKTNGGTNIFGYSDPKIDELLEKARSTYDENERIAIYKEIYTIMLDDAAPMINVLQSERYSGVQDRVKDYELLPNTRYNFTNTWVVD